MEEPYGLVSLKDDVTVLEHSVVTLHELEVMLPTVTVAVVAVLLVALEVCLIAIVSPVRNPPVVVQLQSTPL